MKRKTIIFILFFALIAIGAFLRLYRIQDFVTFLGDQGRDAIIIKKLVTFQDFPAIGAPSSIGQIYLGPFYYYLVSPFLLLFFFNPVGLAVGVSLFSIIGLIISYRIVVKELHAVVALIFLIFSVFAYQLIDMSRYSWNPNLLPIFSFITLYFFYKFVTKKDYLDAFSFGSFLSFSIQLHYLALLLAFPMGVIWLYTMYKEQKKMLLFKGLLIAIGGFILFLSPLILFDIKHDFLNARSFITLFSSGKVLSDVSPFERFLQTNQAFFEHTFRISFDPFIALILFFSGLIISVITFKYKKYPLFVSLHVLNYFSYIVLFSMLNSQRHAHYYGQIYLSFFLLLAFWLYMIHKKAIKYTIIAIALSAFIFLNAKHYYFVYGESNNQTEYAKAIAASFSDKIKDQPIQLVSLPITETDHHYRYFLELQGFTVLPHDSGIQPAELYVLCFTLDCKPTDDPHWQIAAFENKKIATSWDIKGVRIYKIIHAK